MCFFIDIAGTQAEINFFLITLHGQTARPGHNGRQWLGTAHTAKAAC